MFSTYAKKINLFVISLLFISLTQVLAQGGPGDPPGGGGGLDPGGGEPSPGAVPVDAGLGVLLAAGIGYGAKKAYDYRKNKVKSEK